MDRESGGRDEPATEAGTGNRSLARQECGEQGDLREGRVTHITTTVDVATARGNFRLAKTTNPLVPDIRDERARRRKSRRAVCLLGVGGGAEQVRDERIEVHVLALGADRNR
ncbi:hypothetical protein GCM10007979_36510 [Nocardioides albus]|nr:hypothetical protein GCM10007979_36510 [Nocardioides albus]